MSYVDFSKLDTGLRITLTQAGRQKLQDRVDEGESIDSEATLYDLLEDHLSNGWEWIRPEETGALTDAPILSDECDRDEEGLLSDVGAVYWYEKYQILSPVAELLRNGAVEFRRAD